LSEGVAHVLYAIGLPVTILLQRVKKEAQVENMKRAHRRLALRRLRLLRRLTQYERPATLDAGITNQPITGDSPSWTFSATVTSAVLEKETDDRSGKKVRG
jgi:hypothetical protein